MLRLEDLVHDRMLPASVRALLLVFATFVVSAHNAWAADLTVSKLAVRRAADGLEASFTLDILAQPHIFLLPEPKPRLVVDLPAALIEAKGAFSFSGAQDLGESGVRARFARREPGGTRLVFDLPRGAKLGAITRALEGGGVRYIVPLQDSGVAAETGREAPPIPPVQTLPAEAQAPPVSPKAAPLIVLDAGHGGGDPGAKGTVSESEKMLTLAAARELSAILKARGYRVRLTREDDSFIALDQRVERARAWGADLFLSLHADAAERAGTAGASVYTLSTRGTNRTRHLREAKDWLMPAGTPQVSNILFDLTQHASIDQSKAFSETLHDHLRGEIPLLGNSQRSAEFYVLLAPDVPAVLLEMGFITNPADASRLSSAEGRAPMLRAVAAAIDEHFAAPTLLAATD